MLWRVAGKIPHVGIIGAGVAGLRCADVLLQHGVKVTILEARNRIGGRFCQSNALGHRVDLGPNWIHGTDNNPILDIAKETGTLTMNWDGRQAIFDKLGKLVPEQESSENFEIVWELIEKAMKYSNEESDTIPKEKSLYDFFQENVSTMIPSEMEDDEEVKRKRQTILDIAEMWGAFVGSPIQKQSLKFFWMEECIDGENLFVAETYHKVLNKIAEPVLKGANILFGHKVKKIVSNGTNDEPSVTVEVDGKESSTFDEVVTTTPLGYLKRNLDMFTPELPTRLTQAINSIGYGNLDKVYITFPTAFWHQTLATSTAPEITHNPHTPNVTATTTPIHQAPTNSIYESNPNPSHHPGFTHWTKPTYAPSTNPSSWTQEAVNLANLPRPTAHPTLLFYIFGPTAHHIANLLHSHPIPASSPSTLAILLPFFAPYFSRLPNYNPANPDHQPSKILATLWTNDELAGYGSYANFQVGLERGGEDVEVMRKGVPERGLWIAGEHTAPFVALGTVTGSFWAGEGVGLRIAGAYGLGKGKGVREESDLNGEFGG
ncbi:FAD/NAD(P)-binding domain-containing protein [Byssothecium circinans]|uniref:FAD/NAD(P)-binding domain-containing protein n=1 Tax=Byssothecium circinans TaxID=147558 RepID=A0A6A5UE52_9PLEO|nr:FAD/NAD(P)-binding domain-containing protein [Byssothecium circinans]